MGESHESSGDGARHAKLERGIRHPSRAEQYGQGKALRARCPRSSHARWEVPDHRPRTVELLEESSRGRIPELIPVRYGRMLPSPLAFYRGAALNMAADLAATPATGLRVQACGDCHLLNFGAFATPERRMVFDINDFDETLPAPWEWDLKRLATSFVLACRDNRLRGDVARESALACVRSYREHMAEYSQMRVLDVWYARIDLDRIDSLISDKGKKKRGPKRSDQDREHGGHEHVGPQLAVTDDGDVVIREDPRRIYHLPGDFHDPFSQQVLTAFAHYRDSLQDDRRLLLDHFEIKDIALKVVGVGSVGTRCAVVLLTAGKKDPLFLQVKEARASVLEPYAGVSQFVHRGQRIVTGCRLMQFASDLFLGWTELEGGTHYYVRQLKDMKIKPDVGDFHADLMMRYAEVCGWALSRAHARSGQPARISGYMGKGDALDEAIADFAVAYADQTERDHEVFAKAVRSGRLTAVVDGGA
jgi:uncharacterized protein (DUF2252 family)